MRAPKRTDHLFLVRLWREAGSGTAWRGSVDHVRTGRRRYVAGIAEILSCIASQLETPRDAQTADSEPDA